MIAVIEGLTGSGKTWLMSRLALKRRKQGETIYPNMAFKFPNNNEGVIRWHQLSETYNLINGVICIDEAQKLFDAHAWQFLPISFAEKIASHRHHFLDIYTTTQSLSHIDIRFRQNVHELYTCYNVFRFPRSEKVKPFFQIIKIVKRVRDPEDIAGVRWLPGRAKIRLISRFWTRELYDTYANIDLSHFICLIKREKKKWLIILQSRQLANSRPGKRG